MLLFEGYAPFLAIIGQILRIIDHSVIYSRNLKNNSSISSNINQTNLINMYWSDHIHLIWGILVGPIITVVKNEKFNGMCR